MLSLADAMPQIILQMRILPASEVNIFACFKFQEEIEIQISFLRFSFMTIEDKYNNASVIIPAVLIKTAQTKCVSLN